LTARNATEHGRLLPFDAVYILAPARSELLKSIVCLCQETCTVKAKRTLRKKIISREVSSGQLRRSVHDGSYVVRTPTINRHTLTATAYCPRLSTRRRRGATLMSPGARSRLSARALTDSPTLWYVLKDLPSVITVPGCWFICET